MCIVMLPPTTDVTVARAFEEFIIDRRLRNLTPDSIEWYRKCYRRALIQFSDRLLSEVTTADIKGLIAQMLDRGLSAGTINGTLQTIKAFLNWALDEDIRIGAEPRRIKPLKRAQTVPKLLTDQQIRALLAAPDLSTFWGRRDRMILLTFLDTACRVSELCGMDVADVTIPLVRVLGKGRKERLLALSPPVQREMLRYLRIRGSLFGEDGPLFPSRKHTLRLGRNRVGRMVVGYARQAGIEGMKVTPHAFRRQYASAFLKGGGSIVHLQQILGHADITMSRRYSAVFDADCFEASMNLSPVAGISLA